MRSASSFSLSDLGVTPYPTSRVVACLPRPLIRYAAVLCASSSTEQMMLISELYSSNQRIMSDLIIRA